MQTKHAIVLIYCHMLSLHLQSQDAQKITVTVDVRKCEVKSPAKSKALYEKLTLKINPVIKTFAYFPVYDMYDQQELFHIKLRRLFEMDTVDSPAPLAVCCEKAAVCEIG